MNGNTNLLFDVNDISISLYKKNSHISFCYAHRIVSTLTLMCFCDFFFFQKVSHKQWHKTFRNLILIEYVNCPSRSSNILIICVCWIFLFQLWTNSFDKMRLRNVSVRNALSEFFISLIYCKSVFFFFLFPLCLDITYYLIVFVGVSEPIKFRLINGKNNQHYCY